MIQPRLTEIIQQPIPTHELNIRLGYIRVYIGLEHSVLVWAVCFILSAVCHM